MLNSFEIFSENVFTILLGMNISWLSFGIFNGFFSCSNSQPAASISAGPISWWEGFTAVGHSWVPHAGPGIYRSVGDTTDTPGARNGSPTELQLKSMNGHFSVGNTERWRCWRLHMPVGTCWYFFSHTTIQSDSMISKGSCCGSFVA